MRDCRVSSGAESPMDVGGIAGTAGGQNETAQSPPASFAPKFRSVRKGGVDLVHKARGAMNLTGKSRSARRAVSIAASLTTALLLGVLAAPPALRAQESAVAPEKNPPGDIPDDQVFITYKSPQGFQLKVPEGWARKETPTGVSFADKYGEIDVTLAQSAAAPTAASVRSGEAADLEKNGRAVKISAIKDVKLPSGPAVRIAYTSNSNPNPVTNKQIRLENERYLMGHAGKLAALTLSAPAGADNADQWKLMAESFQWN
jgi:hypothetical protein